MTMISKKFPAAALIDGEWITSAKTFSVTDPATGAEVATVPDLGAKDASAPSTPPPARSPPGRPRPRRSGQPSSSAGSISSPPRPKAWRS